MRTLAAVVIGLALWTSAAQASDDRDDGQGILPGEDACASQPYKPVSLPRDDGPHNDSYFEWWWWNGHLVTEDGDRLGFIVYFASRPLHGYYSADATITDLSSRSFHYDRQPVIVGRPRPTAGRFSLRGERVRAEGGDGRDRLHSSVDGYELDLSLGSLKTPTLYLGDGHMTYYCNEASFYARMRMRVTGRLRRPGHAAKQVTGLAYFEHAWGLMPAIDLANWNHFNFQLDDGRDVFIGILRDRERGREFTYETGAISDRHGRVTTLHRGDFKVTPTRYWRRDRTCRYPVEYDIEVGGERLHVRPSLDAQELRATRQPELFALHNTPVYWDGEVVVNGDVGGRGYLDMTRYCVA